MRAKIFRNLMAITLIVTTVSLQIVSQTVEPKINKLPGRFQIFDPSDEQTKLLLSEQGNRSLVGKNAPFKPHDGTAQLKHQDLNLNVSGLKTIPFWSDTFDYHGLRYTYKMVGTDPKRGSATTVIPVEIIPIRWVFSNGMVVDASTDIVDGQTPVQGMINSPIFQDYDFVSGGTHVGNTQYGDAFQRANFWNSVSTRSPNYHVRLGQPTVLPTQTVVVPDDKVTFTTFPWNGYVIPEIESNFLYQLDRDLRTNLGVSPQSLPIIVWGSVASQSGALGYHGAYPRGNSIQTFISVGYIPLSAYGFFGDVSILSHEILEWMDDPFANNYSAGWEDPFYAGDPPPIRARCASYFQGSDLLEVADPFENVGPITDTAIDLNGFTYHLAEGAFVDFFTRNSRSRSVNGQYSFFEIARPYGFDTPPSTDCVSSLYTDNQFFSVPGSTYTFANGMNNKGSVVGYYRDGFNSVHGFVRSKFGYAKLDFPGALATVLMDINDGGTTVGYYVRSDGLPHGFSYKNGRFTSIDFPGSVDTIPEKINSDGIIAGAYDATQPITHGFIFNNGKYEVVDTPYGTQSEAASINDLGVLAGNSWTVFGAAQSGFTKTRNSFTRYDFPDESATNLTSINTFGDLSGYFFDPYPYSTGIVRLFGYSYLTHPFANVYVITDINDNRQILGQAYNFDAGQYQSFVGQPALASGN